MKGSLRIRRVLVPLLAAAPAVATFAQPAQAQPGAASVCVVAGVAAFDVGQAAVPPGADAPANYTFVSTQIICAGTSVIGVAQAISNGTTQTDGLPIIDNFQGGFATSNFSVSNNSCTGSVGGPLLVAEGGLPPGPWSLAIGSVVLGDISASCPAGSIAGTVPTLAHNNAEGVLALNAVPNPLSTPQTGGSCASPPPIAPGAPAPVTWFCELTLAGVAVFAG